MLNRQTQQLLIRAIQQARGREICGFLLGDSRGRQEFLLTRNWAGGYGSFCVGASEVRRSERYAARENLSVQAFIHSHHSGLDISESDRIGIDASTLPWIVVLVRDGRLAWKVYCTG